MKTKFSKVQCSNCFKFFGNNDIIFGSIKCGHLYHQKCLNTKFKQKSRICGGQNNFRIVCYPRYYINEHDSEFLYIRNDNDQQYTW